MPETEGQHIVLYVTQSTLQKVDTEYSVEGVIVIYIYTVSGMLKGYMGE